MMRNVRLMPCTFKVMESRSNDISSSFPSSLSFNHVQTFPNSFQVIQVGQFVIYSFLTIRNMLHIAFKLYSHIFSIFRKILPSSHKNVILSRVDSLRMTSPIYNPRLLSQLQNLLFSSPVRRILSPCLQHRDILFIDIIGLQSYFQHRIVVGQCNQFYFAFLKLLLRHRNRK